MSTRSVGSVLAGVAAVALAARVSVPVPGSPVPQSLQTLAVVLVGAWLGSARGAAALVAYLLAGALGLPVFADGGAGPAYATGPTAGYLAGCVAGAALVGWWVRQSWGTTFARVLAGMKRNPELPVESLFMWFNGWLLADTRLSDHAPFWDKGLPALMVTDTAYFRNPHYHGPGDRAETLDYAFMANLVRSLELALAELAGGG